MTNTQHIGAPAIIAAIASRPSFSVALLWISRCGAARARSGHPTPVGQMCFVLQSTWGAVVNAQTMTLALETSGFKIAARSFGPGLAYELATNISRASINQTPWRTEMPNPARWAWAADGEAAPGAASLYANLLRH